MSNQNHYSNSLHNLAASIEALEKMSEQLLEVMEEQVQAIISSEPAKIEELTEQHNSLQGQFKKQEKVFADELKKNLSSSSDSEKPARLTDLKDAYPEVSAEIDHWKMLLIDITMKLQQKHSQLVQLLEFALERNTSLMHSIYSLSNKKNSHYRPDGETAGVVSGVAINQEA